MSREAFQKIMEQAISEMRDALGEELEEAEVQQWDPDAFEQVVRQFTQQLGQQLLQVWAEVKTEQAKARAPFVPVAAVDPNCTDGSPSGG